MNLSEVAQTVESLEQTNSRNRKEEIIRETFSDIEPEIIGIVSGILTDVRYDDIGLGKRSIRSVLDLDFDSYSEVSYAVKKEYNGSSQQTLGGGVSEVGELREVLGILDEKSGNDQKEYFENAMTRVSEPHILTQAILNDLDMGVSSKTVTNALTDDLSDIMTQRLDGLYPDTESLVRQLRASETDDSSNRVTQDSSMNRVGDSVLCPTVGEPFKPMLAKSADNPHSGEEYVYEPKIDGYRLIIHHSGSTNHKLTRRFGLKTITRRLNDVTESLPELEQIKDDLPRGIYDCEIIAEDNTYKSTSERVGRTGVENPETEMRFAIFDVVSFEGEDVSRKTFEERRSILEEAIGDLDNEYIVLIPQFENYGEAKIYSKNNFEGVMEKDKNSEYIFGKRSSHWKKIKYTEERADVRIVELEEGSGRNKGTLGNVVVESSDGVNLGSVGSGFTDEQRNEMWNNKSEYIGKTIEVAFEGLRDNFRFPTFERFRNQGEPDSMDRIESLK